MNRSRRLLLAALVVGAVGLGSCGRGGQEETATKGRLAVCACESHFELVQKEAEQFKPPAGKPRGGGRRK